MHFNFQTTILNFCFNYRWFSLDVIAAMLVHRTIEKKSWEFDSIIMQNTSHNLLLLCAPTWPSHHVTERAFFTDADVSTEGCVKRTQSLYS